MPEELLFIAVDFVKGAFGMHARYNRGKIEIFVINLYFYPRSGIVGRRIEGTWRLR